ncbi:non-specific ribonucleoside hydrolase RihC isoform X2 [Hyalella azteca]|nr:non-specific ribonucleoside hydrolase RihC isoform X2 [Hyalella azteca]
MLLSANKRSLLHMSAITTVHGNTALHNVNKNVLRLLHCVDMLGQVAVHSGCSTPLVQPYGEQSAQPYHGKDGFGDTNLPHPDLNTHLHPMPAALKIVEEVNAFPGSVHLLAIGPLTNVAVAKMLEPRLLYRLASLHIMGGNTTGRGNKSTCGEFNFLFDAEAAQNVLSSCGLPSDTSTFTDGEGSLCPVFITPLETCIQAVNFPFSLREEYGRHDTPQAKLLNLAQKGCPTEGEYRQWATFDELATARLIDTLVGDAFLPLQDRHSYKPLSTATLDCNVTVELQGSHTRGMMVLDRRQEIPYSIPASLLTGVNVELYKRYLTSVFT